MKTKLMLLAFLIATPLFGSAQLRLDTLKVLNDKALIYSIIIAKNNKTVYRAYFNHQDSTTLFNDQSLTKSIIALLIGIAIDQGYIQSVDQQAVTFLPELKNDLDLRKRKITIRQIMNQASGLYHEGENVGALLTIANPSSYVLKAPLVSEPGQAFRYNNAATHLLSVILTRATKMDTHTFAQKTLFAPLGIQYFDWKKMKDGYDDGCGLLSLRLRSADMLKIGNLILNNGKFGEKQLISTSWITSIKTPEITYKTAWGLDNSLYGLCWYHADYQGLKLVYGLGWGGQFLFLIPSLKSVIVTNASIEDQTAIKRAGWIMDRLLPAIVKELKRAE